MKANELYKNVSDFLSSITDEKSQETEIILKDLFNLNKKDFILESIIDFDNSKKLVLDAVLEKRKQRIPLQYILEKQSFRSYEFFVDNRVLIPRPETEILVDLIIEKVKEINLQKPCILDLGTGSGCIAISLAKEISDADVYALDISEQALEVAKINSDKILQKNEIKFLNSDKLEIFKNQDIRFDIIVSNPPYIPYHDYVSLDLEVKNNEPFLALVDKDSDGLSFYRYLAEMGKNYLTTNGYIFCELGINQAKEISEIFKDFSEVKIFDDYSGIQRHFYAKT